MFNLRKFLILKFSKYAITSRNFKNIFLKMSQKIFLTYKNSKNLKHPQIKHKGEPLL